MPLTNEEREFLDAYVYEATHEPFGGPATNDLRGREIYYADLHGLLTAYHREACAKKASPFGKHNHNPPTSPWADRDEALSRSRVLLKEYTRPDEYPAIANADSSPPPARAAIAK
jgi:hypothetical protein